MAAVVVMLLFMCLAPLVFVFPTSTQLGCFVSLRTRAGSWTLLPFCACFSYGYLWPCCPGRRRREETTAGAAAAAQEEQVSKEKAMGMMHKMRERMLSAYVVCVNRRTSGSGRASSLSSGERSCCHRGVPRLIQWVRVVISLAILVQAPITSCSGVVRLEGQAGGYADEFQLGNKGTDALVFNRGYKPNELLSPAKDWISGEILSLQEGAAAKKESSSPTLEHHARAGGQFLEKGDASWEAEDGGRVNNDAAEAGRKIEGGIGLPAEDQPLSNLGSSHFGRLIRDCFRAKCSPSLASNIDLKQQPLNDELPGFFMKATGVGPPPQVSIIPPFLEWGPQSVYTPSTSSLIVVNTYNSTELRVFQPFSTNLQFYAPGFEETVVSPGEKLSIPIVFLPRVLGPADAMLIVQTSAGGFLVHAQGSGVGSPYQVVSLQGLRMASGETLRSTITLYNPHEEVLNVTNVYVRLSRVEDSSFQSSSSSGSTLSSGSTAAAAHHDLCQGNGAGEGVSPCSESPSGTHEVECEAFHGGVITRLRSLAEAGQLHSPRFEPQSRESIADLEFEAIDVGRYTGSLHIKLQIGADAAGETQESSSDSGELLMVPVDLQVVGGEAGKGERKWGAGGQEVVPVVDILEFGIFTEEVQTSKMDVILYNPGSEAVAVEDITPVLEDDNIVHIEYRKGLVLPPTSETEVAVVTYMGKEETVPMSHLLQCDSQEFWRDRMLIVKTNSSASPTVEVPYRALVFHGSSLDCGDPAAQGSVGFVPEISNDESTVGGGSAMLMMQGGASGQQRVHFANDRTVPFQLFQDLKKRALSTGVNAVLSPSKKDDDFCCYESSPGHLTVAAAGQSLILLSSELLFPLVQTGKEELHWVNIVNPSEEPLHVQLLVSSKAEPTGRSCQPDDVQSSEAPGLRCRSPGDNLMLAVHDDVSSYASNVFSFADGALVEAVVEPHGNSALGPVVFRPPERCSWIGLLSVWNNLTQVEWIPLLGSGGSGSLTFLDGNDPINLVQLEFNRTGVATADAGATEEHAEVDLHSENVKSALCSRRVSREFLAKNTGDVHLHVAGVELYGGGCSAHGFVVNSCREEFLLAPGQSTELSVSFQPDLSTGIFQRDLQLITSAGVVQLPVLAILADYNALCSVVGDSTKLYKVLLWVSSLALLVVLTVFFRMLAKEMAIPDTQSPTSVIKPNPLTRDGRHMAPLLLSSHPLILSKSSSGSRSAFALAAGLGAKCGLQNELDVQSKGGGGNGPSPGSGSASTSSGQGKLKDSPVKGSPVRVSKVVGVSDTCTSPVTTLGPSPAPALASGAATTHVSENKAELPPSSPSLSGLRVKIPNSAAWSAQKSILGSPTREASSPGATSAQFRKGAAATFDRRNSFGGKFGGGSNAAKIAPEPLTDGNLPAGGQVMVKQSLSPLVRSNTSNSSSTGNPSVATTVAGDAEKSQQWSPQTPSWSVNSKVKSPKKSSQFLHTSKPALSPSPKHAQAQTYQPWAANEKEKPGRKKKRRSNVSTVKQELASKVRSGSSSPSSSPASPATPAACSSRPVSPLLQSLDIQQQQPDTPRSSSSSCGGGYSSSGSKDYSKGHTLQNATVAPLSKLDVQEHYGKPIGTATAGVERMKLPPNITSSPGYWGDSLSVDDASTALREMAQANSFDLTWATSTARGNHSSVEKSSESSNSVGKRADAPKDWLSVARKAGRVSDSLTTGREGERLEDKNWPGNNRRGNNCKSNTGSPALTPSATFPRRQGYERGPALAGEHERGMVKTVGVPQPTFLLSKMPPVARAPGAKLIPKPLGESRGGDGVSDWELRKSEDCEKSKSSNIWNDPAASKKTDGSLSRPSELSIEEDKSVYNIWGDHFQEFSRCSTNIVGSVTPYGGQNGAGSGGAAGQSLAVLNAAPSFFSSFPVPTLPSLDNQNAALTGLASGLPVNNNTSEGFSVFSQAPDVEALCLPSTLFHSPKTTPRSSYSPYVERNSSVGNSINLGLGRNVVKYSGFGGGESGSLSSSPRKPRGPYSPSLGPSSHGGNDLASFARSESTARTTNDTSFWSGLNLHQQQGSSAS